MKTTAKIISLVLVSVAAACSTAPKPRELEAFETIKNQQSMYAAAQKRQPQLVADADRLLAKAQEEWRSKDLEESRRDSLMGQTKLKTAYAFVEQDEAKARADAADKRFRVTEEELARVSKDLAQTNETISLLHKVSENKATAEKMAKQLSEEQKRTTAQQKLAAAELALKGADSVNASRYAAVDYGSAKDMIERANMEMKRNDFVAAATSAELAKSKAEQAQISAKPQHDAAESGRDAKAKSQEISRDAAGLPGTTVRIDRRGEVQRLVLPYGKLFAGKVTVIKPGNDDALDALAAFLKKYPSLPVQVVGHTDSRGKRDALLALSAARAQSVYNALLSRGVDAKRMTSSGMGGDEPVTDNKTAAGRATNNRVEVVLILQ